MRPGRQHRGAFCPGPAVGLEVGGGALARLGRPLWTLSSGPRGLRAAGGRKWCEGVNRGAGTSLRGKQPPRSKACAEGPPQTPTASRPWRKGPASHHLPSRRCFSRPVVGRGAGGPGRAEGAAPRSPLGMWGGEPRGLPADDSVRERGLPPRPRSRGNVEAPESRSCCHPACLWHKWLPGLCWQLQPGWALGVRPAGRLVSRKLNIKQITTRPDTQLHGAQKTVKTK